MTARVYTRSRELCIMGGLALLLALLFIAFPDLDLQVSALFYQGNGQWLLDRESLWLWLPYRGMPYVGETLLLLIALLWLLAVAGGRFFANRRPPDWWQAVYRRRHFWAFLLVAALLGPVLLTETIKTTSGRTRPINIEQFGGTRHFSPAFIPANECHKNCSFVSGHVSAASFALAFVWWWPAGRRRRALMVATGFAALMALARIIPGGHFLSDCLFGFFVTYFSLHFVEWLFLQFGWHPH